MSLTRDELAYVDETVKRIGRSPASAIPVLQALQEHIMAHVNFWTQATVMRPHLLAALGLPPLPLPPDVASVVAQAGIPMTAGAPVGDPPGGPAPGPQKPKGGGTESGAKGDAGPQMPNQPSMPKNPATGEKVGEDGT